MTLDTYSHLWPDSDDATRAAVDLVLGGSGASSPIGERPWSSRTLGRLAQSPEQIAGIEKRSQPKRTKPVEPDLRNATDMPSDTLGSSHIPAISCVRSVSDGVKPTT